MGRLGREGTQKCYKVVAAPPGVLGASQLPADRLPIQAVNLHPKSAGASRTRGKGCVGAGTSSPPSTSDRSQAQPGTSRSAGPEPGPAPAERTCRETVGAAPSNRRHLRGGGRGGSMRDPALLHLQAAAPPRQARRHQSAPVSRPLPTPFAQAALFPQWLGVLAAAGLQEPDVTRQRKWRQRQGITPRRWDYPRAAAERRPPLLLVGA